jgi:hypothetical protein
VILFFNAVLVECVTIGAIYYGLPWPVSCFVVNHSTSNLFLYKKIAQNLDTEGTVNIR